MPSLLVLALLCTSGAPAPDGAGPEALGPWQPAPPAAPSPAPAPAARPAPANPDLPPSPRPEPPPAAKTWEVGGFVDVNYGWNSNLPDNNYYRGTRVTPRTGEFSLNHIVAYVRHDAVPGRLSPIVELAAQAGPAADALMWSEPRIGGTNGRFAGLEVYKHVARANIGLRTRGGFELVGGLQASPLGIGNHWTPLNWNYTVTWQRNGAPFYLQGLKLAQTFAERHRIELWLVNGWQLLSENNRAPSLMLGYVFTRPRLRVAEYVWVGPEQADLHPRAWRLYSDTQFTYDTPRFGVGAVADIGADPRPDRPTNPWDAWLAGAAFARWRVLGERRTWDMAVRPELFWDRDGRIYGIPQVLSALSYTNNLRLLDNLLVRVEYRYDRTSNPAGFFFRGEATASNVAGLARSQHTVFLSLAGIFAHRFGRR